MWNPPELPKHNKAYQAPDSTLNSLMRDVDSYLLELNEEEQPPFAPPARSHSLQEPQRQSPILANRSNTTHRAYVK
jgi:hypothetical protein